MSDQKQGALVGLIAVPALVLGTVFSIVLLGGSDADATCTPNGGATVTSDPGQVPDTTIAGYGHEQLVNAAYVIEAGKALDLSARDQTIGVMTAMGESSLRVVDHGPGVSPERRDDIFVPFQRLGDVDNTTGLGLGLALSRGFVEGMGGTIEPEDTPGGGLTMVVSLPTGAREEGHA